MSRHRQQSAGPSEAPVIDVQASWRGRGAARRRATPAGYGTAEGRSATTMVVLVHTLLATVHDSVDLGFKICVARSTT